MQAYHLPQGLIADLVTPLKEDLSFDKKGFTVHLMNIKPHVDAVMILSPIVGEGLSLSMEDKKGVLKTCVEVIKTDIPIFVNITGKREDETKENMLEFQKLLNDLSYRGKIFWVDAPLYYHSNRGLPDMYKRLASTSLYPFILYNNPELMEGIKGPFKRKNIRTSILKELSLIEDIVGLIFVGGLKRALNYQKAVRARSVFKIYDGDEQLFLNFPNKNGLVSISANLVPQIWKQILSPSKDHSDNFAQIWDKGYMLNALSKAIKKNPPYLIKEILMRKGLLDTSYCRTKEHLDNALLKEIEDLLLQLKT